MSEPTDDAPAWDVETDPPEQVEPDLYEVVEGPMETAVCEGLRLPRRRHYGARGVLLVDRPAGLVYLLDADDDARVFRGRERRSLAGDPTNVDPPVGRPDDITRAAYEFEYDVTAAPWAGLPVHVDIASPPPPPPAPKPRKRASSGKAKP